MNSIRQAAEFSMRNDAKRESAKVCVWHIPDEFDNNEGVFVTSCGHTVELGENESDGVYVYCPYCGRRIHWDHVK